MRSYWTFPMPAFVWEYRNGAIVAGGRKLDALAGHERDACWAELNQRVQSMVSRLDDGWLVMTAFWMVEDIHKSFFREFEWTAGVHDYLTATENEGRAPDDIRDIRRYREDGHAVADSLIARWHRERQSSVYLNIDFDDDLPGLDLSVALSPQATPGTALVFRNGPPAEGSEAYFVPPPGVRMPAGVPECPPV